FVARILGPYQIRAFVAVPVAVIVIAGFSNVLAAADIECLTRTERKNTVQVPASDYGVHSAAARGQLIAAFAERQFVNPRCRKDVWQIGCRRTFVSLQIVGVLDRASLYSIPSGTPEVQASRPSVGNEVCEPVLLSSVQRQL